MNDENYSADYFYYYMKGENLPKNYIKAGKKNYVENLTRFKARIHWYFDAELSSEKMLCEYLCDSDGNENSTFFEVEQIINSCFEMGQNVSNTATEVLSYLTLKHG
jgi:hypothetical protein